MRVMKYVVAGFLGFMGLVIVESAIYGAAISYKTNPVTVWVANFEDVGLTPGLILLCTATVLFFLPRKDGHG